MNIMNIKLIPLHLLGTLFTWSAMVALVDRAGAAFAQLTMLALLCAWVLSRLNK